jgi:hypothetical protein
LEDGCGSLWSMLGEREAVVLEARPFYVHGVPHVDLTLVFSDRAVISARLGAESAPADLSHGEEVVVSLAMNTVVAVRRTGEPR